MSSAASRKGILAEIAFESRLVELGYVPICKPARVDDGVDFVVLTSKGWVGVQVKAQASRARGGSRNRTCELRLNRGSRAGARRDRAHDLSRGVSVFAWYFDAAFDLIPTDAFPGNEIALAKAARYRDAWAEILGEPGYVAPVAQAEIDQLDLMWRAGEP